MIRVINNIDAFWETDKYDVALVGCSIYCMMDSGFAGKLKNRYPIIQEMDDKTGYADTRKLGKRLTLFVGDDSEHPLLVSLMYICKYPNVKNCTLDYDALENSLVTANAEFKGKKVITTILGSSDFDGKGDKDRCLELIERCCPDLDIDVYDYEQLPITKERSDWFVWVKSLRETDPERHKYLYEHQREELAKLFLLIGGANEK